MKWIFAACLVSLVFLAGCGADSPKAATKSAPADKYPLDTCVVTGEKLGSMGAPYVVKLQGRTIKLCCSSCIKELNADNAKYLAMLDEAEKKAAMK